MKQTFKYWIYARVPAGKSKPVFELSDIKWSGKYADERVFIGEHEVEHDLPDERDITQAAVASLEAKKEEMRATAAAAIAEVDSQIQSLLAIEQVPA